MYDTGFFGELILELYSISGKNSLYKTFSRSKASIMHLSIVTPLVFQGMIRSVKDADCLPPNDTFATLLNKILRPKIY